MENTSAAAEGKLATRMIPLTFTEVREIVAHWLKRNQGIFENNISVEVLRDNIDCLRFELNFGEILAEIIVEEPGFAPYRYVSFQAADIIDGVWKMVYTWYDEEETTAEEIVGNLDKALAACRSYTGVGHIASDKKDNNG